MSDEDADAQRALSILAQALQEAGVRERKNVDSFPPLPRGIKVYWWEAGDDLELVLISRRWASSQLRASIPLKGVAVETARLFPDDIDAVKALVEALKYMQGAISEILPHIRHHLTVRAANVRARQVTLSEDDQQTLKMVRELVIDPMDSAIETRQKELRTSLRADRGRGGREPDVAVSDEKCAKFSTDYPALLKHWKNVKEWHGKIKTWRDHAKLDFPDTPDDLLDKLSDPDPYGRQPSVLAHEHAARRCGIPANTYSYRSLSRLRQRGDKILSQSKAAIE